MSIEANKAIERRFFEAMNEHNVAALDKMLADNVVDHNPSPGMMPDRNGIKQFFAATYSAFPDFHSTLEDMIAEGDKVVSRFTARGTHKGEFMGNAPTGKRFAMPGTSIHRIVGGKIVDNWVSMDMLGVMLQLGLAGESTSLEANRAIVRRFIEEVQNQHKMEVVDQVFAPDYSDHATGPGIIPGKEGFKQFYGTMLKAFPDLRATIYDQIAEGDKVVTRKTFKGTHKGEYMGVPPTGKQIEASVIDIFRIADGKIAEHWMQADMLGMMQQLGMIPPPGQRKQ